MMAYEAYKLIHIFGILLLLFWLGALYFQAAEERMHGVGRRRRLHGIAHGAALLIILVGGFGLLARLGVTEGFGWPWWVWGKIAIWVLLGVIPLAIKKSLTLKRSLWFGAPILGAAAAYLAIYKPL
jgi:hypothetical protein